MAKEGTRSEAFAYFGASGKNPRWSWSARSADGKIVVLTMWQDEFRVSDGVATYRTGQSEEVDWGGRAGNQERIENINSAVAHCDGKIRVVIACARDVDARVREIESCFPHEKLVMRITAFDVNTGEFSAVSVTE
ncbi:MAG TPA: hypothetical protein VMF53_11555 [Alphaproteobacteria bacterium]|nr:hypothetical protein [Alphaproteobacteria bacterium]